MIDLNELPNSLVGAIKIAEIRNVRVSAIVGKFDFPLYIELEAIAGKKIRPRPQYNCRHTYATMCLMPGMNPAFITGQLGHSVQVQLSTYAKWLNSASEWSELEKLEMQLIGTESVQD